MAENGRQKMQAEVIKNTGVGMRERKTKTKTKLNRKKARKAAEVHRRKTQEKDRRKTKQGKDDTREAADKRQKMRGKT